MSPGVTAVFLPSSSSSVTPSATGSSGSQFGKILISEIQIAGNSTGDEFIELYNPNDFAVSLEGWAVKKKTSSGKDYALVSQAAFKGKTIAARSYFLLGRGEAELPVSADIWWAKSNTIAEDNTIILYGKRDGEAVMVDAVGFGDAYEFEGEPAPNPGKGETLSRKNERDTDNNRNDFIVSLPTPRNAASGAGFVAPQAAPSPVAMSVSNPSPSPQYSLTPSLLPSPSPSTSPTPSPSPSQTPQSSLNPTPSPELSFSPTPSPSPSPTPVVTPSPSPSPESSPTPTPAVVKILINEIQIAGVADADDEFIELYNPSDAPVDLTGWMLKKKTSSGTEDTFVRSTYFAGKVIAAYGYLLLADPAYTGSIAADIVWPQSYYLAASSTLLLYASGGVLIDKVGWLGAADFEGSAAPTPGAGQSIERRGFQDTDNNADDFELKLIPTPTNSGRQ
jgi:hypothetical protein